MENWGSEEVDKELTSPAAPPEGDAQALDTPAGGDGEQGAKPRRDTSGGREMYLNIRVLAAMMTVFVLVFTFVARIIVVSGPSMENTLLNGDLLLVWSLGYTPQQGDIVVLTQESYQEDSIVKRVIATGGQRVDIDYVNGVVYVDGAALEEE